MVNEYGKMSLGSFNRFERIKGWKDKSKNNNKPNKVNNKRQAKENL